MTVITPTITSKNIITKAITDITDLNNNQQIERIEVTPNPDDITGDSDFGFNINIDTEFPYQPYVANSYVANDYVSHDATPLILPYVKKGYMDSDYVISYYN